MILSSEFAALSRSLISPAVQSTMVPYMSFIFPEVNVGVNLVRSTLHLHPPRLNKWAFRGSFFSLNVSPRINNSHDIL